jgi:hypothetical protein
LTPRAEMTSVGEQLREYFDDHGVGYRIIAHEAAASADEYHAILGTRYEQMPKAIFLRYQGKERKVKGSKTPIHAGERLVFQENRSFETPQPVEDDGVHGAVALDPHCHSGSHSARLFGISSTKRTDFGTL